MENKKIKLNIVENQTRANGETYSLNTSKVLWSDELGNILGVIGVYEDITQKINNEKLIKTQEVKLIEQGRLAQMGEMISMIAHQWRQPLTVIGSMSSLMQMKNQLGMFDDTEFNDYLRKIDTQVKYLSQTIDDFRDFFKPDKEKHNVNIKDLIRETLDIIGSALNNRNIHLDISYNCNHNLFIYKNEVKQVLLNIIKNAQDVFEINNTENPTIKIDINEIKDKKCEIKITDNGGGIDEEIMKNIFDPYFSTKKEKNGTGLGLYMSKTIIEKHSKGVLNVESSDGNTTFYIVL
jgi:signal transduction histidine kinase